jgi:hypothetical protein
MEASAVIVTSTRRSFLEGPKIGSREQNPSIPNFQFPTSKQEALGSWELAVGR